MLKKIAFLTGLIGLIAFGVWLLTREPTPVESMSHLEESEPPQSAAKESTNNTKVNSQSSQPSSSPSRSSSNEAIIPESNDPRVTRLPNGEIHFNLSLDVSRRIKETENVEEILETFSQVLSYYRMVYGENPVGTENFEITEQLLGKNPKRITFVAPEIAALKENELVDPWETPLFFHALSGQHMEIRSAGRDKILWTKDDFILENAP